MQEKQKSNERMVYLNGEFLPESEAKISLFDSAFIHGDSVQDVLRTFNWKPFKFDRHMERLWCSLRSTRINIGLSLDEVKEITSKLLKLNRPLYGKNEDSWMIYQISAGIFHPWREKGIEYRDSTVGIHFKPIDFKKYANYYKIGIHGIIPWIRRVSPQSIDPKIKQGSRMDLDIACREVKNMDPDAYPILLDQEGNVAEGDGQNVFIVKKGVIQTPTLRNVLGGISRETAIELAKKLKIPVKEADLQPYDLYNASEAFLTGTSFCIFPLTRINWVTIGNGKPGTVTSSLLDAWSEMVGMNVVKQAMSFL